jgi:murein L,D-transpeptidase YafK
MTKKSFALIVLLIQLTVFEVIASPLPPAKTFNPPLPSIDYILVQKKDRILKVYSKKKCIKTYKIALGFNPIGHKEQEGDGKTPEGNYFISHKNPQSQFYLSLKISYPSLDDKKTPPRKE